MSSTLYGKYFLTSGCTDAATKTSGAITSFDNVAGVFLTLLVVCAIAAALFVVKHTVKVYYAARQQGKGFRAAVMASCCRSESEATSDARGRPAAEADTTVTRSPGVQRVPQRLSVIEKSLRRVSILALSALHEVRDEILSTPSTVTEHGAASEHRHHSIGDHAAADSEVASAASDGRRDHRMVPVSYMNPLHAQ